MRTIETTNWKRLGGSVCPVRVGDFIAVAAGNHNTGSCIGDNELPEMNIQQAKYLAWLVEREEELELSTATCANTICFRYVPHKLFDMCDAEVDSLNKEILRYLHTSGVAAQSYVGGDGRFAVRPMCTSRGTNASGLESMIREVVYWGRCILGRRAGVSIG